MSATGYLIKKPMHRLHERRDRRPRRTRDSGERAVEACFAVLTVVILGMMIGMGAYAVLYVIPEWQRYHSQELQRYRSPWHQDAPWNVEFESHSPELK
jgi:hypothetical protein